LREERRRGRGCSPLQQQWHLHPEDDACAGVIGVHRCVEEQATGVGLEPAIDATEVEVVVTVWEEVEDADTLNLREERSKGTQRTRFEGGEE
jgi:hypothetical protein